MMQTITLKISDDFMPKFMGLLDALPKNKVKIKKDVMALEIEKRVKEIENGSNPAISSEKMWEGIDKKIAEYKNAN
jgi:hypothetical protein